MQRCSASGLLQWVKSAVLTVRRLLPVPTSGQFPSRAQPGPCEGLKRTNSGSEPDKLPLIRGPVLNKTAASYGQGKPEPQLPKPTGDRKKLLSWPEPCGVQRQVQLRDSKQPERSSALRSISNNAKDRPIVGLGERVYESTKLAALFDVLVDRGCPADEILRNVNLTVGEVHSPKSRISLAELLTACKNAIRLSSDPHLPYRIGTTIHISAYGMYGFAILCCPDFRKAMAFAELYHALAAPLATIEFTEEEGLAGWVIEPNARAATDPQVYRFITEMQIGIHISLMRDIMGPSFTPDQISVAYPEAHDFGLPPDQIGRRLAFASGTNQIIFRSAWLDQAANLGNKTTYPAIVALCDDLLNDLKSRIGVAGEIRALLLRDITNPPTLAAVAKLLEVSDRSLRRQLREQGISFRGLLDELRMQIALKYLRTTRLANEDIALSLGFSDAANFRRAFRRWTNKSPSEIRGE
jgi:AraC-like DNA-binding protein